MLDIYLRTASLAQFEPWHLFSMPMILEVTESALRPDRRIQSTQIHMELNNEHALAARLEVPRNRHHSVPVPALRVVCRAWQLH